MEDYKGMLGGRSGYGEWERDKCGSAWVIPG